MFIWKLDFSSSSLTAEQQAAAKPWIFGIFAALYAGLILYALDLILAFTIPHVVTLRVMFTWFIVTSLGVRIFAFICNERLYQIIGSPEGTTFRQRIVPLLTSMVLLGALFCLFWYGSTHT